MIALAKGDPTNILPEIGVTELNTTWIAIPPRDPDLNKFLTPTIPPDGDFDKAIAEYEERLLANDRFPIKLLEVRPSFMWNCWTYSITQILPEFVNEIEAEIIQHHDEVMARINGHDSLPSEKFQPFTPIYNYDDDIVSGLEGIGFQIITDDVKEGDLAIYVDSLGKHEKIMHFAYVDEVTPNGEIMCKSKLGSLSVVVQHRLEDVQRIYGDRAFFMRAIE